MLVQTVRSLSVGVMRDEHIRNATNPPCTNPPCTNPLSPTEFFREPLSSVNSLVVYVSVNPPTFTSPALFGNCQNLNDFILSRAFLLSLTFLPFGSVPRVLAAQVVSSKKWTCSLFRAWLYVYIELQVYDCCDHEYFEIRNGCFPAQGNKFDNHPAKIPSTRLR